MGVIFAIACILVSISMPSIAKQPVNLEITPLIGYRFSGDFDTSQDKVYNRIELSDKTSYGLLTAWFFDRKRQGKFLISYYDTDFSESSDFSLSNTGLGITYAQLGGNVQLSDGFVPIYATGGFGLTHLAPKDDQLSDETRFSVNIGLASKIKLSERVNLRLDSRVYGTFFNSDSAIFCDVETCAIYISSDIWFQAEVGIGITYRF